MSHPATYIIAGILVLGAVEATAYWWMHPAPAGQGESVLVYQPGFKGQETEVKTQEQATAQNDSSDQKSAIINQQSSITPSPASSTFTPLPEVYRQAAPMLRCTGGQVLHAEVDDTLGLHLAFFEWDDADTGSVLEAFRHMPEACMGSIGMTLVSKEKPVRYAVGNETLVFDHTIFREAGKGGGLAMLAPPIHAFRAVWVAGMANSDARQGIGGDEFDHLRTIRLKSAFSRFRPSHARVIQGAVRGAPSGEAAWQTFEATMLKDLKIQ